jgi:hypothetical protein
VTMADDTAAAEAAIARALEHIERLYAFAAWTIANINDPDAAFRVATNFAARAGTLHDEQETKLRKLRATQAVRIRDADALSLQALADRISISKARADQLVRDAKKEVRHD